MADREEFSFEEEEKSYSGTESDISWMEREEHPEAAEGSEKGGKGSRTRVLLLLLLLAAVGAAGYYFLLGSPEPAAQASQQIAVNKQPITIPPRPVEESLPIEKEPVAAVEAAVSQEPTPETPQAAEEEQVAEKSMEMAQAAQPVSEEATVVASIEEESPEPPAETTGGFTVAAGAFLLRSNLAAAEKKVIESGFVPQIVQKKKVMDMTRLRVGIFSPQEGRKKLEELSGLTSSAFYLPAEGGMVIYAASFQNLDKARIFADRLYKRGLRVEEEPARVEIPLYLLSFGSFADLESAREAAGQVRAAGLDAMVVKDI